MSTLSTAPGPIAPTPRPRVVTVARVVGLSLSEARPLVQAIVLLRFVSGVVLVAGARGFTTLASAPVLLTGVAWLLANSAVYLFNGLCDIATDRTNGRSRPLARGDLGATGACLVCAALAAGACLTALLASPAAAVLVTVLLVAGAFYSRPPARLARMSVPYVSVAIGGLGTYTAAAMSARGAELALACFGLAMTGWMVVVGAVLKDLGDVRGDRRAGRHTPALRFGVARASRFGATAATVLAAALLASSLLPGCATLLAPAICLAVAALVMSRHCRRVVPWDQASLRAPYRTFMAGQYAAHAALLLTLSLAWLLG